MKKRLLFTMLVIGLGSNAQMKLTATSSKSLNTDGSVAYIDSTQFNYAWDKGMISTHQPEFTIMGDAPVYLYQYRQPTLDYTTRELWGANNYPLSQNWMSTKTYNGSNQCTSDEGAGFRELFTYNANGKVATHTFENESMPGVWDIQERMEFFYDANDRLIAAHRFDGVSSFYTNKDSVWYDGTTNNVLTRKSYESADGMTFYLMYKSETTWTGNQPTTVNYFEDDDSDPMTPIVWFLTGDYTFTGSNCTLFEVFLVVNDVPTTTLAAQWDYSFNGSNQLISDVQSGGFGDVRIDYTYQADGLLETIDQQEDQGTGLATYRFVRFYYTDVTGIEEETLEFSVYPNPTTDKVNISQVCDRVEVFTMNGELVLAQSNTNNVDLSSFIAGNYLIKVSNGNGTGSKMIVKN
ncbi:MAG: T9SS type A sorting domain-containing protein [Bacteroidetes bacterium]|nr:MAG: T9SS type A sorting domain-containing protein [Bacteroidota bacterium]